MQTLSVLSRTRYKKLYNLLPEDIGRKAFPPFFTTIKESYIDWQTKTYTKFKITFFNFLRESIKKNYSEELVSQLIEKKENSTRRKTRFQKNSQISSKSSLPLDNKQLKFQNKNSQEDQKAAPIQFTPYQQSSSLFDKGCITCGKENIKVDYYESRHMCLECRSFLKTYYDDPAVLFLNEIGDIEVYGVKNYQDNYKKIYYQIPEDQLKFNKYRAYATLAGPEELIVLLHDQQDVK